jgi:glycosyltransferase involved in cell wall biosynthesis
MKLSVLIPVYNEVHTLETLLAAVRAVEGIDMEIILVDDFSTDGTRDLYPQVTHLVDKIVLHDYNQGKGAAIRTAIQHATGDYCIIQDADLEYNPQEFHLLLEPVHRHNADVVYGSRFQSGRPTKVLYFWHSMGNKFLTLLSNAFTDLNLTDMETCYKLVRTSVLKKIKIEQNRFGLEPELTAKLAQQDLSIFEVGISYNGRSYDEGKKIGWKDGVRAIYCILKYGRGRYRDYGKRTLQRLQEFNEYAEWMFERFARHVGRSILEVGAGIGNNVSSMAKPGVTVTLTDFREDYVAELQKKYADQAGVSILRYDATQPPPAELATNSPDTIIMLNVLEHIESDELVLKNLYDLVTPGGRLIVLVPAFQSLYCKMDENLEHFRRYNLNELRTKMEGAGFGFKEGFYFNAVGAIGWFVVGKILRSGQIKPGHISIQRFLMPITRFIDGLNPGFGLSVVCIGEKPLQTASSTKPTESGSEESSGEPSEGPSEV